MFVLTTFVCLFVCSFVVNITWKRLQLSS